MPEPTTVTIDTSLVDQTRSMSSSSISWTNVFSSASSTNGAVSDGTAKQIDCSEDACVMSGTLVPVDATAPNARAATPGTPSIPRPSMVTNLCLRMAVTALTTCPFTGLPLLFSFAFKRVPGWDGLNVLQILNPMPAS